MVHKRDAHDTHSRDAHRAQEKEHHQRGEDRPQRQIRPHVRHRRLDVAHIVGDQFHAQTGGSQHGLVDLLDTVEHGVLDIDDVRACFPAHRQADDRLAVHARFGIDGEMVEFHVGDVAQPDHAVPAAGNQHVFQLFQSLEAADGAQQVAPLAAVDFSTGHVLVAFTQRRADVHHREAAGSKQRGVQQNAYLPLRTATHIDL